MKTANDKAKRDNAIMRALKLTDISHLVAKTSKGDLMLKLVYGGLGADYRFVLDAVPMDNIDNKTLLEWYFDEKITNA